jgi:luciferase family oxidoreductase group 1
MKSPIPCSALDFAPLRSGESARDALQQALQLAMSVESFGYRRLWLAEHHGLPMCASAATSLVIGHIAERTSTLRLGSGGVMLPNHSPLVIAEQFGTLELLYPGRIDLGVGRSTGTANSATEIRLILRATAEARERFPDDLRRLLELFRPAASDRPALAIPGAGLNVPIWLLGSSTFAAREAASLGLPFAFASHIGPDALGEALARYRTEFVPSPALSRPYIMICVMLVAGETDSAAQHLFSSMQQLVVGTLRNRVGDALQPPAELADFTRPDEGRLVERALRYAIVGSAATLQRKIAALLAETAANELMFLSAIHNVQAQRRSFEIAAAVCRGLE